MASILKDILTLFFFTQYCWKVVNLNKKVIKKRILRILKQLIKKREEFFLSVLLNKSLFLAQVDGEVTVL